MTEWRAVEQDPAYEVSDDGAVRTSAGVPVKPWQLRTTGYLQFGLRGRRRCSVHRAVALAFCPGYAPGLVVNHRNGDRLDNRAENLEWVTQQENCLHSYRELGRVPTSLGKFSAEHPTSKAIVVTSLATGQETTYACALDAVRAQGFDSGGISRCCSGKWKSHQGHAFRFAPRSAAHA